MNKGDWGIARLKVLPARRRRFGWTTLAEFPKRETGDCSSETKKYRDERFAGHVNDLMLFVSWRMASLECG